jgi:hypothetical protein
MVFAPFTDLLLTNQGSAPSLVWVKMVQGHLVFIFSCLDCYFPACAGCLE